MDRELKEWLWAGVVQVYAVGLMVAGMAVFAAGGLVDVWYTWVAGFLGGAIMFALGARSMFRLAVEA